MKQSISIKNRESTAFLYLRLSRDDNIEGDSYSIQNQEKLLIKSARKLGYTNFMIFKDDGISGVFMDRPGFQDMIKAMEKKQGSALFVKDLSRLGRNYREVGYYMEEFFPEHDIRLVAVSENIDTNNGEDELTPFRNLMNEWYSRDISKKRRLSNTIKGNSGEPLGLPPYGYQRDPENPKHWMIDEEAAAVIRRIYQMALDGFGTEQIAKALSEDHILTPAYYWRSKGENRAVHVTNRPPDRWNNSTVNKILSKQEYCGDLINFKTYSKSYKNKKRIRNTEEDQVIFKDAHEPIVERAVWEKLQQKRGKVRKRKTSDDEKNIFSGFLVCADCGKNLWYHFNQANPDIKYFNCSNYKGNRGTCTSTHYVRVDFLEQVVLGEVRRLTKFASQYENEFVRAAIGHSHNVILLEKERMKKELKTLVARDKELDILFEHMYEDNVSSKISDERFLKMTKKYEDEQAKLVERIKALQTELDKEKEQTMSRYVSFSDSQVHTSKEIDRSDVE